MVLVCALLLTTAVSWAQQTPEATPTATPANQPTQIQPVAEANPPQEEYSGPAILSRTSVPSLSRESEADTLKPYVRVMGVYDTGLAGVQVTPQGQLETNASEGFIGAWGLTGTHLWGTSSLSVDYHGNYQGYTNASNFNGSDNVLMIKWEDRLSSRLTLTLSEEGAIYQNMFSIPYSNSQNYDPTFATLATNTGFNDRTFIDLPSAQLVYQATSRTSFSGTISGYTMQPQQSGLAHANGFFATGDVAHRISRYQTIGLSYDHSSFYYSSGLGQSQIDGVSALYSVRLGRRVELSTKAGIYRSNFSGSKPYSSRIPICRGCSRRVLPMSQ